MKRRSRKEDHEKKRGSKFARRRGVRSSREEEGFEVREKKIMKRRS